MSTAKLLRNVPLPDELHGLCENGIVVDFGSGFSKIGYSGDDSPMVTAATVTTKNIPGKGEPASWFKAYKMRESNSLYYPMNASVVSDWNAMERMMRSLYSDLLKIDPAETDAPLLVTEGVLVEREQRESFAQLLFEKMSVPSLCFALSPVLSLFSSGRGTGVVVEMGHGSCSVTPTFEGFALFHSISKMTYAGEKASSSLAQQLRTLGYNLDSVHETEIATYIKEKLCEVRPKQLQLEACPTNSINVSAVLPDGLEISLGRERFSVCEAFFDPPGDNMYGIQNLLVESIKTCDADLCPLLLSNIVLGGGTTLFRGLVERLTSELVELLPSEKIRIHASTERKQSAWVGGSILASLPTFRDMCLSKQEYEETGPHVVHRNCF